MNVLVTGAAGFIGYHVSKRLLDRGDQVIGVDNLNDYYDPKLKEARLATLEGREGFRFVRLDISDNGGMRRLFESERPRGVINLAAQAGVRYSLINPRTRPSPFPSTTMSIIPSRSTPPPRKPTSSWPTRTLVSSSCR